MCIYKSLLFLIFIKFVKCADRYPYHPNDTSDVGEEKNNEDENKLDLIEKELQNILTDDDTLVKGIKKILKDDYQPSPQQEYDPHFTDYDPSGPYGYKSQYEQQNIEPGNTESSLYQQNFYSVPYVYPDITCPPLPIPVSQLLIQDTPLSEQPTTNIAFEPHLPSVPVEILAEQQPNIEPNEPEESKFSSPDLKTSKIPESVPLNQTTALKQPVNTGKGSLPKPRPGLIYLPRPGLLQAPNPAIRFPTPSLPNIPSKEMYKPKEPQPQQTQPIGLHLTVEVEFNVTQTQPAKPTEMVKELEPERVTVELGSDEEDQDDQGTGDGGKDQKSDQPSDQPSGSGGAEGGDEKSVSEGLGYMGLKSMIFFKKDEKGIVVEMSGSDYKVLWNDMSKIKFKFYENLEMIIYNGEVVYNHLYFRQYIKFLIYNKKINVFTGNCEKELIILRKMGSEWVLKTRKVPDHVKLYKQDLGGNDQLLSEEDYIVELSAFGSVKFIIMGEIKCYKITVKDIVVWKKTRKDKTYPTVFCITDRSNILVYFEKYILTFGKKGGKYVLIGSRKNVKDY
ncbi:SVSP family protein [Theileria parva strain Muguga]|uniref:Uncharacterized protein n=1 Tax=Theileria parva TaxID=5875 RepID=Q4N3N4_THEPA|nr:SVSP family protein [Theileria parva strain Muguga]EAN33239.1 SVSP family protein [Theileria parva strain Muguga]|eukprot:XP_765522.1 hypothetical protein [Theileria parva strain Muguga]